MTTPNKLLQNRIPEDYAEAAAIAHAASEDMLARLDFVMLQPQVILEVGCGDGFCTKLLKQRYPTARVIATDPMQSMVQFAQKQLDSQDVITAEADALPFEEHSVDLIISNLFLPWCDNLEKTVREWRRVLRPEGLLMFTSLGPDTMLELQQLSAQLPRFIDMHDIGDVLVHAGFADPVLDVDYLTLTYRNIEQLSQELKITGMAEGDFTLLPQKNNVFPLTYELIYGHAWGPALTADHVADEQGVVRIPLSHLRRKR